MSHLSSHSSLSRFIRLTFSYFSHDGGIHRQTEQYISIGTSRHSLCTVLVYDRGVWNDAERKLDAEK